MASQQHVERRYTDPDGRLYVLRWTACNKPGCKACPHGPYWYRIVRNQRNGRIMYKYVGKELPCKPEPSTETR